MLDESLKTQLKAYLERLVNPIELVASVDDSAASAEMMALLNDIVAQNGKISLREDNVANVRKPSFAVNRIGEDTGVRFAGLPMGHEFTSLVLALLQVSGYPPKVEADVIEQIKNLQGDFNFEVYISLSCHNCPDVVQAINLMAALNPGVRTTMIDGALFQDEVNERQIMAVPCVYLNGEMFGNGRMLIEEILAKMDTGAADRDAARLNAKEVFDVLVVGGGPAGAAAAIYAARKGIRTGVVAERFGGQVLDTMSIENFISVKETVGPKLARALEENVRDYKVDIMNLQRASALLPAVEEGGLARRFDSGALLKAKTVLLPPARAGVN
jgi:alkyl hydroperoxide reductase subunit F